MVKYRCPGCGKGFAQTGDKTDGLVVCPGCQRILENPSPEATTNAAGDQTDPNGVLPFLMQAERAAPPIRSSQSRGSPKGRPTNCSAIRDGLDLEALWNEQQATRRRRRILLLSLSGIVVVCCAVVAVVNRTASNQANDRPSHPAAETPPDDTRVAERVEPAPPQHAGDEPKRTAPRAEWHPQTSPAFRVLPAAPAPRPTLPRLPSPDGTASAPPVGPGDKPGEVEDPHMQGKLPPPPLHIEPDPDAVHPPHADEPTVPEDVGPEVQSQVTAALKLLHERRVADRVRGAGILGRLGAKARSATRDLCATMLDSNSRVSVAAANALKQVDADLYELALSLIVNTRDYKVLLQALRQVEHLPHRGAVLTPLVVRVLKAYGPLLAVRRSVLPEVQNAQLIVASCIRVLTTIAPNDSDAVLAILALLGQENDQISEAVLAAVPSLRHISREAEFLAPLTRASHSTETRLAAIRDLLGIADKRNHATVRTSLDRLRFDRNPVIRQATEKALEKLDNEFGKAANRPPTHGR